VLGIDWSVRRSFDADLQRVRAIHTAHAGRPLDAPSSVEVETWRRMMSNPDLTVYLAEHAGDPVGTATMMLMPNITYNCAPTAFIEAVVVVPEHRRRGIARSVMQTALADARDFGCDKVQLLSHKRHREDGAHTLYIALGFVAEAEGFRLYLRTPDVDRA
jgi:GNAT superfamily N-acetyltransferase